LVIVSLFLLPLLGFAQSLQVVDTQLSHSVKLGEEVRTVIKLQNVSDQAIHVLVRREQVQIGSSQKSFYCWDNNCVEPESNELIASRLIEPGEIVETFVSVLESGLDETISSLKYLFYNREDPSDFVSVELSYTVKDQSTNRFMFNSNVMSVSDIYPNPVSDIAFIDYLIYDEETEAKIVFHNVLGRSVSEYTMNPVEQTLKINTLEFKPGVYFYTLYVDNEGKVTKKLVVKK